MILPLPESETPDKGFIVTDIENWPNGDVISIDTCWRDTNGIIQHESHVGWGYWYQWILDLARGDTRYRRIYAHNGGGWDWLSLVDYLAKKGVDWDCITANIVCSKIVTLHIKTPYDFQLHFCDSYQLLRGSLDKLGSTFGLGNKVDTGGKLPHEIYLESPKRFVEYHRQDTELLLQILERCLDLIRENVAKIKSFGYTVGSTALKLFRTTDVTQPIPVPTSDWVKGFLRKGYTGGRTEVFQVGHFRQVYVYDINSLYPYVMANTLVPISDRGCRVREINAKRIGSYQVEWRQRNMYIPPVLSINGNGVYRGGGFFYSPELHLLRKVDPTCSIRVLQGYEFFDTDYLFRNFVERLYRLRVEKGEPLATVLKFFLNSLYGKMAQKAERSMIICFATVEERYEWAKKHGNAEELSENSPYYVVPVKTRCEHEHVGIAGMITSAARVKLYEGMLSVGSENLLYVDTDSIHSLSRMADSFVSNLLGDFKPEFVGEACYTGKKLYALRNEKGTKIRAKGVTVGGNNGADISFDSFIAMATGSAIEARFQRPPSALEVFRGEKSCQFRTRKRTLRKTYKV